MKAEERFEDGHDTLRERDTVRILKAAVLAALTALAAYLCWKLLAPFVNAFTWAFALAVVCAPLRKWLFARMPRFAATTLILVLVVAVITLPLTFVLRQLLGESLKAQAFLRDSMQANDWRSLVASHPRLGLLWSWADQQLDLGQIVQRMAAGIVAWIAPALARSVRVVSQTGVALLALFFFLRDAETLLAELGRLLPLSPVESGKLFARVSSTLRTAVYGRVLIGFLQGFLGGVIFAIVGLPAAVFWGTMMSILAVLPFLGAFVIWVPAAAYLLMSGHWISALILAVWGLVVIHPVDNVLYPILVGARVGMHPLMLFVAFVGGLIAFGPTGLILGPCIIALTAEFAEIWKQRCAAAPMEGGD
jgi:predicted PurR-regulated permease PerM